MQRSCPTCRGRVRDWIGDARTCPRCRSTPSDRLVGLALPLLRRVLPPLPRTLLAADDEDHAGLAAQLTAVSGGALHRLGDGELPWPPDLVVLPAGSAAVRGGELTLPDTERGGLVLAPQVDGADLDGLPLRWRSLEAADLTPVPARHGVEAGARLRVGTPPVPGHPPMEDVDRAVVLHGQRRRTSAGVDQLEDLLRRTQDALARTAERHRTVTERSGRDLDAARSELTELRRERDEAAARAAELTDELRVLRDRSAVLERDAARWRRLRRTPLVRGAAAARRGLRRITPGE